MGVDKTVVKSPMKLVFASGNANKIKEVAAVLGDGFQLQSLVDIGFKGDIPETGLTLEENAAIKSRFVKLNYGLDCCADDSGLLVDALNGAPGVHSARYAGHEKDDNNNIDLLLKNLEGITNRKAKFVTIIHLVSNQQEHLFEGELHGTITEIRRGKNGFGYDPVFIPDGYSKTLAEMLPKEKNNISHRAIAIKKLAEFLRNDY